MRDLQLDALFRHSSQGTAVAALLVAVFIPFAWPWRLELLGFVVGAALSVVNNWLLVNSIQKLVALVLQQGREVAQFLYISGMIIRWFLIFGVLLYIAWTEWCGLFGLLAGYFVPALFVLGRVVHFILFARVDYS